MSKLISVVVPMYSEELVVKECYSRLTSILEKIKGYSYQSIINF